MFLGEINAIAAIVIIHAQSYFIVSLPLIYMLAETISSCRFVISCESASKKRAV